MYDGSYLEREVVAICRRLGTKRMLDLGCGNGYLTRRLADAGFDMVGCDPSASGIEMAQRAAPRLTFRQLGVDDDPAALGERGFDAVVSLEVVEHLPFPRLLPRFASDVLRPGGYLIVSTPYHGYAKNLALSITNTWDQHFSPLWDGGHIKFWSKKTLRALGEAEGFALERFVGAGRLPWLWKSLIAVFKKDRTGDRQPTP